MAQFVWNYNSYTILLLFIGIAHSLNLTIHNIRFWMVVPNRQNNYLKPPEATGSIQATDTLDTLLSPTNWLSLTFSLSNRIVSNQMFSLVEECNAKDNRVNLLLILVKNKS